MSTTITVDRRFSPILDFVLAAGLLEREMSLSFFVGLHLTNPNFVTEILAEHAGDSEDFAEITEFIALNRKYIVVPTERYLPVDAWLARYTIRKIMSTVRK